VLKGVRMFQIKFYKDRNGREPVKEYIAELANKNDKDSRIKLQKIRDYIKYLSEQGKQAKEPYVKHLEGEMGVEANTRQNIICCIQ
jgi:phage-related protein